MRRTIVALTLVSLFIPGTAGAGGSRHVSTRIISAPSPFPAGGCGTSADQMLVAYQHGMERDISISVDPSNPRRIAAAWGEDSYAGIVVAVSRDGGGTWTNHPVPGLGLCSGGKDVITLHPRLSFGPDGHLYMAAETGTGGWPDPRSLEESHVVVLNSGDGGKTWSAPTYLDDGLSERLVGFHSMTAEPDVPGAVDVVWGSPDVRGDTFLSRSTDGGLTWTRHLVHGSHSSEAGPLSRVVALPDGTLLVISIESLVTSPEYTAPVHLYRSLDKGVTWSGPTTIAEDATPEWASAAVSAEGTVYAAWVGPDATGERALVITRSADSGVTWSDPAKITGPKGFPFPGIAVDANGTVGTAYTDSRNDDNPDDERLIRDAWFAHSHDGGETWEEEHLAGPFQFAPDQEGFFQETAAIANGFGAVFAVGPPLALDGATDVVLARIKA
jgi:hypothetical protein